MIPFVFCRLQLLVLVGQRGGSWRQQVAEDTTHSSQVTYFTNLGHETTDAQSLLIR